MDIYKYMCICSYICSYQVCLYLLLTSSCRHSMYKYCIRLCMCHLCICPSCMRLCMYASHSACILYHDVCIPQIDNLDSSGYMHMYVQSHAYSCVYLCMRARCIYEFSLCVTLTRSGCNLYACTCKFLYLSLGIETRFSVNILVCVILHFQVCIKDILLAKGTHKHKTAVTNRAAMHACMCMSAHDVACLYIEYEYVCTQACCHIKFHEG